MEVHELKLDLEGGGAKEVFDTLLDALTRRKEGKTPAHGLTHERGPFKANVEGDHVVDRHGSPVCFVLSAPQNESQRATAERIAACLNACCGIEKGLFPHLLHFMLEQAIATMSPLTIKLVKERLVDLEKCWQENGTLASH